MFIDVLFSILFLLLPIYFYLQLRLAGYRLLTINIVPIASIGLFLFSYLGLLPLYFQWDEYRVATGITDKLLVFKILLISGGAISCFLWGVIIWQKALSTQNKSLILFKMRRVKSIEVLLLLLLLLLALAVLIIYLSKIDQPAIMVAIKEGAKAGSVARSKMGNDFIGKYHWYKLFMNDLLHFVSFALFASWLLSHKKWIGGLFFISFVQCTFVTTMAIEKAPFAYYLVGLFMVVILIRCNGKIPVKSVLKLTFSIIFFLMIFYVFFMGSGSILSAFSSVLSRAFSGSIAPAYFYLEYFPEHQDYLLGRTFPNPGGVFPYTPVRYTVEVMSWKFPHLQEIGVIGSAPMAFWGEAYANFGLLGIPIISLVIGGGFYLVGYMLHKIQPTAIWVGFYVWLILLFKDVSVTGFSQFLFNPYLILITFIFLLITILAHRGRINLIKGFGYE